LPLGGWKMELAKEETNEISIVGNILELRSFFKSIEGKYDLDDNK
jgi:hypothetical protein